MHKLRGERSRAQAAGAAAAAPGERPGRPGGETLVQRWQLEGAAPAAPAAPGRRTRVELPAGGGRPLPDPIRLPMQRASGYDLSPVRVHEGPEAEALGAIAFTRGIDLFFRPGAFDPDSASGRRLIGHELAHVVQQGQGRVAASGLVNGVAINDDAGLEGEADALAERALGHDLAERPAAAAAAPALAPLPGGGGVVQRAIGMELETTLPIVEKLGYHEAVYDHPKLAWKITEDDGKVEFVTRPLRSQEELVAAVRQIQAFVRAAGELLGSREPVPLADIVARAGLPSGGSGHVGGSSYTPEMLMAKPQVTVGIPMDRLAQLLADARDLSLEEYDQQHEDGRSQEGAQRGHRLLADETSPQFEKPAAIDSLQVAVRWGADVKEKHPDLEEQEIERAVGLMAYILKYLNDAYYKPQGPAPEYAKAYFPVMARTHFVAMYESLGPEAALLTTESILACWGVDPGKCNVPMLRLGLQDSSKERGVASGPTILDWLDSIVGDKSRKRQIRDANREQDRRFMDHYEGDPEFHDGTRNADSKDLLSRGDVAYSNVSMGLLGMDRAEGVPLAVVEFRQFPSDTSLQAEYWDKLAARLYEFYDQARNAPSSEALLRQVHWSKDVLGSLRRNAVRQTNELRDTTDDDFNERVLAFQTRARKRLAELSPSDHDAISEAVRTFAAELAPLRDEHAKLPRTKALAVTRSSVVATLERQLGGARPSDDRVIDVLNDYFTRALGSLHLEHDAVTKHNLELQRVIAKVGKGPREFDDEAWADFYQECGEQLARLEALGLHHKQHQTFDGAPIEEDQLAPRTQQHVQGLQGDYKEYLKQPGGNAFIGAPWRNGGEPGTVRLRKAVDKLRQVLADGVQNARAQQGKERTETVKALIAAFTEKYAELRALCIQLEPTHGRSATPPVPGRSEQDFGTGGDCLFDSTAAGLGGAIDAAELRLLASERVRMNPLDYVDRLVNTGAHGDVMAEMEAAADFLAVHGNWNGPAGDLAPIALGDALAERGHQLVILNPDGSIRHSGPNGGPSVFIYYNGRDHYTPSA